MAPSLAARAERFAIKDFGTLGLRQPATGVTSIAGELHSHHPKSLSEENIMSLMENGPAVRPAYIDGKTKLLLIGGQWALAASGKTFETRNPATGELLAHVAEGDREDIDRAVTAARRAFNGPWSKWKPAERQMVLLKLADLVEQHIEELAALDTFDMGAPITRTRASRQRALGLLRYYAGLATALHGDTIENSLPGEIFSYTLKEPIGVVGGIIPWNSPLTASIWKIGPALATGCTVVLKPAEQAPLTALRLGELCLEAGVPPGVVNIVPGYGATAGAALAAHLDVDKLAFTGSDVTGRKIVEASAGNLKRLSLELGGKSPDIVFADADLDAAIPGAAMAVFANSGQICSAGARLFVEEKVYEEFTHKVAAFAKSLKVGNGVNPEVQVGPLISHAQLSRVTDYLKIGVEQGATPLAGGERLIEGEHQNGYFVPPTVFTDVRDDMRIAREEIFGPVISAIPFRDIDEVIERANATPFGLGSGLWTRDVSKAHRLAKAVRAGSVWVNCYQAMDPAVPFGGYKMSGYGRESGRQHLEEYLNVKAVWIKTA
jgi:aldehyde dehydrogenase (NAD+)